MSGIVMWALLLKYAVMMQAGPEKAIQPSVGCCEIQGEEMILKKYCKSELKKKEKRKKKKKKEKGETISRLWYWTGLKNVWLLRHDV